MTLRAALLTLLPVLPLLVSCKKKDDDDAPPLPPATVAISMVSVAADGTTVANGFCSEPAMSADGNIVAFASSATNLIGGTPAGSHIFIKNMTTGVVTRILGAASADPNDVSMSPSISDDGRYIAFVSEATNMIAAGTFTADRKNVYLHDRTLGTNTLVSHTNGSLTTNGSGASTAPAIASSGDFIVFQSDATDLTAAVLPVSQGYRYGRVAGTNAVVSLDAAGTAVSNGVNTDGDVSSDGRYVVYRSTGTNIHADDGEGLDDIYVRDMTITANASSLVSRANGLTGANGNFASTTPRISNDGSTVTFMSTASNFEESFGGSLHDIFARNWQAGAPVTSRVSKHSSGAGSGGSCDHPEIGQTGQFVVWHSFATGLVSDDSGAFVDTFRHDFTTHYTIRVSVSAAGGEQNGGSSPVRASMTPDGLYCAFASVATNLVSAPAANGLAQIYRKGSY